MDIGNFFFLLKQNYKVIKLEMQRNVDDSMYITTQSAFTSKCIVSKLDQLNLNRKMEGREKGGWGKEFSRKLSLLEYLRAWLSIQSTLSWPVGSRCIQLTHFCPWYSFSREAMKKVRWRHRYSTGPRGQRPARTLG